MLNKLNSFFFCTVPPAAAAAAAQVHENQNQRSKINKHEAGVGWNVVRLLFLSQNSCSCQCSCGFSARKSKSKSKAGIMQYFWPKLWAEMWDCSSWNRLLVIIICQRSEKICLLPIYWFDERKESLFLRYTVLTVFAEGAGRLCCPLSPCDPMLMMMIDGNRTANLIFLTTEQNFLIESST